MPHFTHLAPRNLFHRKERKEGAKNAEVRILKLEFRV